MVTALDVRVVYVPSPGALRGPFFDALAGPDVTQGPAPAFQRILLSKSHEKPISAGPAFCKTGIGDYLVALAVLALSVFGFLAISRGGGESGLVAAVSVVGAEVRRIDLSRDCLVTIPVGQSEVGLEVAGGRIRVASTTCPREECRRMGWVASPGETIVCLPQRLVIEVCRKGGEGGYDAVAY